MFVFVKTAFFDTCESAYSLPFDLYSILTAGLCMLESALFDSLLALVHDGKAFE